MKTTIKKYLSSLIPSSKPGLKSDLIAELEAGARERDERISSLEWDIAARERMIREMRSSWSWRLTGPLRAATAEVLRFLEPFKLFRRLPVVRQTGMDEIINRARGRKRPLRKRSIINEAPSSPFCSASIVIPTKNAGPEFRDTLRRIKGQQGVENIEIVVIDSGSMDGTLEAAREAEAVVITIPLEHGRHGGGAEKRLQWNRLYAGRYGEPCCCSSTFSRQVRYVRGFCQKHTAAAPN